MSQLSLLVELQVAVGLPFEHRHGGGTQHTALSAAVQVGPEQIPFVWTVFTLVPASHFVLPAASAALAAVGATADAGELQLLVQLQLQLQGVVRRTGGGSP